LREESTVTTSSAPTLDRSPATMFSGKVARRSPKVDDPSDSLRIFNGAMLRRIDKFREQIAGKHSLHKTKLVLFRSFFGSAIEARRFQIDAAAQSPPNARGLAAPSDRTTLAQRPVLARRMTSVTLQVRNWLSCARSQVLPNCLAVCQPVRNWRRAGSSRFLSVTLILRFASYKAFGEVRDDGSGTAGSFALGFAAARGVGYHHFCPADDVQDTNSLSIGFSEIFMVLAGVAQVFRSLACCKKNVGRGFTPARRDRRALTVNQNPAQICVAGRRGVRLARTQARSSF
jgi:hypothetical protein